MVGMGHAILDGAAIHDHGVVEQAAAVGLAGLLQLLQPCGEHLHVEDVDLGDLLLLVLLALVMGQVMMPFLDADDGVRAIAAVVGQDEAGNAGAVGAEGQREDVEHQLDVVLELRRNPLRAGVIRQFDADLVGHRDPPLDVAHRAHVLVELLLVVSAQLAVQPTGVLEHEVEHAGTAGLTPGLGLGRLVVVAAGEQAIEGQLGIHLGRHRRGGRAPRHVEGIGAAVARVALAGQLTPVGAQLEAGKAGLVAHLLGGPLVDRDAHPKVGSLRLSRLAGGQEGRRGAGVVAGTIAVGAGLVMGKAAEHGELVAHRGQRLEDAGQVERRTHLLRRPVLHHGPVGDVHEGHAQGRLAGGGGLSGGGTQRPDRGGRGQEWEGHRGAQAPQEGASRLGLEQVHDGRGSG